MKKTSTILVASNNPGKIKEIKDIFYDFNIISLKEIEEKLKRKLEINEEGNTFCENALQKVIELVKQIDENYLCIADDSGISIDALDGFPGIHTQRWMDADDHKKNLALLKKMKNVPNELRTCHYTTAVAIANKDMSYVIDYTLDGTLSRKAIGNNGFGFDEIFMLDNGKTLAEISSEEKYLISPRKKALEKIKEYIFSITNDSGN